ncbi:Endonuclease YncB, thermonuclease family [Desulfacinum infernum DSM 9756]|uniref:Endonuclease YncB, thermonuclease family n=1 Tax=Desulfacinum infernum DSM 9756 TaxID=1121391 RepID=A0A1M5HFP5_9BACT|nr:thermonuclease family protein [Desulfacinum infernum]MBC7358450.1 thermonuclease family protein [Desulfacinum sp.]SHG14761.1 Endonuclease YncB, thermonuclease family [Desulfacinum infernum DSM 9756]
MRRAAILIAALFFFPSFSFAWPGKVVGVMDGDTLEVLHQGRAVRIRLYGVDCPEKRQDFGQKAKQFASSKVYGAIVRVEPKAKDRYGRTVAIVFPEKSSVSLNQMLVKNGLAWVYRKYCRAPECSTWLELERQARERRLGLWSHPNPVPPWDYRHSKKRPAVKSSPTGPCACNRDLDCRDFRTRSEAEQCFEHCLRLTGRDVHRLDRDGDGRVCESLP